jgi:hypothetical protein
MLILGSSNPFEIDKLVLLQASRTCHLHDGSIYFFQHSRSEAPAIHTTRALGDTDLQIACALQALPAEILGRYRIDTDKPAPQTLKAASSGRGRRR